MNSFKQPFSSFSFSGLVCFFIFLMAFGTSLKGQQGKYKTYFDEAYEKYPTVPQGLLEAVAYTNTRLTHLKGETSCQGLPTYYGVMGLVEDGKGYFKSTLDEIATLSGFDKEKIKKGIKTKKGQNRTRTGSVHTKVKSSNTG